MQDLAAFMQLNPHPQKSPEQERLKCPRCDSTNTKFCYYNNYNLSQPRHYCKSCRRYWTKGGTLRNIPVGGGTRKSATANTNKRSAASVSKRHSLTTAAAADLCPQSTQNPNPGSGSSLGCVADGQPGENGNAMDVPGSFVGSLSGTSPQFGSLMMFGLNSNESGVGIGESVDLVTGSGQSREFGVVGRKMGLELELQGKSSGDGGSRGFLGNLQVGDRIPIYWGQGNVNGYGHDDWNGNGDGNGWTDLAI